jgi:ERCC4-type nuclease
MVISMSDTQVPIAPPTNNKKKKQDGERRLMRKDFDEALLVLQIEKGCSIRKTVDAAETADTIYRFTSSISQIPYK